VRDIGGLPINTIPNDAHGWKETVSELKDDIKRFAHTRIELLQQELHQKARVVKAAAPLVVLFVLLLSTAYLLLTLALVSLLATWFEPNPYRWFLSLVIVGVVWAILGGIAGVLAWHRLSKDGLLPRKTIDVLKTDKTWLEDEVKKNYEHTPDSKVGEGGVRAA
jgi:uncharacterized membrane protein YqjE